MPSNPAIREARLFIEERLKVWQPRMGLSHFEIDPHFIDGDSDFLLGASRPKNRPGFVRCSYGAATGNSYTACVETRWNYQLADVYFFMPNAIYWTKEKLDRIVVHELQHIILAPEQYLLEYVLEEMFYGEESTAGDNDIKAALYYERMEMATESACRPVYEGWTDRDKKFWAEMARNAGRARLGAPR